ncbi:alpha/beta hydrolase [Cryptosporangium phraense]|uniref:Alpha/beta fold hydrolase n=1 Tax=Cryptosporangium phraense TaxID=2593070 RepID=A0A545ATC1_9ACTN|nr:alpha/beta fold hydrolase [Cryptosporangium phraense]TQS44586.1 alpha/beta fold hydrolase [Cryptosporangium phraense]
MSVLPGAEPFLFDAGSDAPAGILLSHGFTGSPKSIRPWGEALHAAGYTVSCPLLPGHGTRWPDLNRTTWEDWYAEVEREYLALRERLAPGTPIVAGGLSMGGTLVTRLAEVHAGLPTAPAGLLLVNPSYFTLRKDAALLPVASKLIGSFPGIRNDIKKPGQDELAYSRLPLKAAASLSKLWKVVRADLGKVTVPIRLFRSADDHVVEPENSATLLAEVSSTAVSETVLTDSFHVATLDNDAPVIFAGSVDFVGSLLAGAR